MPVAKDMQDPKETKPEEATTHSDELASDELEAVSGGAGYIKFDGVDGEATSRKVSKVDAISIKQTTSG